MYMHLVYVQHNQCIALLALPYPRRCSRRSVDSRSVLALALQEQRQSHIEYKAAPLAEACLISKMIDMLYARAGLLLQCEVAVCGVNQIVHDLPNQGCI